MELLKKGIFVLFILICIPFLIALFSQERFLIEKEIIIDRPYTEVFNHIKYVKNQEKFSIWASMDPNMKRSYKGEDGRKGFIARWESKKENVGTGEQEIIKIDPYRRIDIELRFEEPFESISPTYIITQKETPYSTRVIWGFEGNIEYPMNMMLWFTDIETLMGNNLQLGLNNLKETLAETNKK